jgi:hypothetical protein
MTVGDKPPPVKLTRAPAWPPVPGPVGALRYALGRYGGPPEHPTRPDPARSRRPKPDATRATAPPHPTGAPR